MLDLCVQGINASIKAKPLLRKRDLPLLPLSKANKQRRESKQKKVRNRSVIEQK